MTDGKAASGGKGAGTVETRRTVLLVTGMSGAGRTTALKALEDMGFETADNIPLSLLPSLARPLEPLLPGGGLERPIAVGVDIRTRDFAVDAFLAQLDILNAEVQVLFLDCADDALRNRYSETRHRHPLATDRPVIDGIRHERRLLAPLRDRADVTIDTTDMAIGDLTRVLNTRFGVDSQLGLTVIVDSFGFRRGLPREADLVFDVRFLANPHYDESLRPLTGRDPAVAAFIEKDRDWESFFGNLISLLGPLLPRYRDEGRSYLTIAFGCTGGRHRSVFMAEKLASWLRTQGQAVQVHHRDIQ
ncbi:MAG: RNase adapter RapZ [Rhodospirillales bacterium]|nr:RNase adapter RapZ [Rhodospirillales bacterium]MCW8862186.1 RNase adapter RapZ [Rhodospirillales bacterium]MCW8953233.1 RNase adapter RapZ [Rhodospirillales bacterium]MCW8970542.1 RNase adapter RapZ [Rhodospirillales bacterium]MCW9002750.1 RNase adapter RapZ [Rhodospirillales bacterium]